MKKLFFILICITITINASAQEFKIESSQLILPVPIVFETGSDKLKSESEPALQHIKKFLEAKTYISLLRIEGHTDSDGNAAANQTLTEKRALAVARWLVTNGIDCKRLIAVGFGSTKPIAANATPEGKAQNRRTEIRMASLRGRAIGGFPVDGGGKVAGEPCQ